MRICACLNATRGTCARTHDAPELHFSLVTFRSNGRANAGVAFTWKGVHPWVLGDRQNQLGDSKCLLAPQQARRSGRLLPRAALKMTRGGSGSMAFASLASSSAKPRDYSRTVDAEREGWPKGGQLRQRSFSNRSLLFTEICLLRTSWSELTYLSLVGFSMACRNHQS